MEYRKTLTICPETDYWNVQMGPIPNLPAWHEQSQGSSYAFPTVEAATRFAKTHQGLEPERQILIVFPDGRKWSGKAWVT